MSGLSPGKLTVAATLTESVVTSVDIRSDRPLSLASRLAGRSITEAIAAVGLLHAVCGQSHAAALHFAAEVARGREPSTEVRHRWSRRLAAERVGEHLRELLIEHPDKAVLPEGREAIALAQSLARGTATEQQFDSLQSQVEALAPVLAQECANEGLLADFVGTFGDPLIATDDEAVMASLGDLPDFIAHPSLPSRSPQVGPAARLGGTAARPGATRIARLAELETALTGAGQSTLVPSAISVGPGQGFAAVESPRGRLYYLVKINEDDRLIGARVLAPTEWNFHPNGPFAKALVGRTIAGDAQAPIARLAADFCPCVAVVLELSDRAHA